MSFDGHIEALSKLCRICGERLVKSREQNRPECQPLLVDEHKKEIDAIWGINTWLDNNNHPRFMCHKCGRAVRHCNSGSRVFCRSKVHPHINWEELHHSRTGSCTVCTNYNITQRGGKPTWPMPSSINTCNKLTQQVKILPFSLDEDNIFIHINSSDSSSPPPASLDIINRSPDESSMFTCVFCLCILHRPVESPCLHNFCSQCLTKFFQFQQSNTVSCPICTAPIQFMSVHPSPSYITTPLKHLSVRCNQCQCKGNISNYIHHKCPVTVPCACKECISSEEQKSSSSSRIMSPGTINKAATLFHRMATEHRPGDPVPPNLERMADRWTHRKMQATTSNVAMLSTGGMV